MNILFHCADYPPALTGVSAYIRDMSRALAGVGHRVAVVTARQAGCEEESVDAGVTVRRCYDRHEARSRSVGTRVLGLARDWRADVIEGADHLGECASLFPERVRPPILIKAHSCNALNVLNASEALYTWQTVTIALARLRVWRQCRAEVSCIRQADMLVTPSARMLEELNWQFTGLPERSGVIPNPIHAPEKPSPPESARPTLLFVGRLTLGKGIHALPGLLARVCREVPEVELNIVGPDGYARGIGSTRRWLERKFGADLERVRFAGPLYGDDLHAAYGAAWVVVVPSRWDNFPQVVLEAMVRRRAVVASPHGGMPEMLEGTGCPVADPDTPAFADAVLALLRDALRRKAAADAGHRRALSVYAPDVVASLYTRTLEKWL
jgi:glycosyltransferase involved in cell wall biosynthesis